MKTLRSTNGVVNIGISRSLIEQTAGDMATEAVIKSLTTDDRIDTQARETTRAVALGFLKSKAFDQLVLKAIAAVAERIALENLATIEDMIQTQVKAEIDKRWKSAVEDVVRARLEDALAEVRRKVAGG